MGQFPFQKDFIKAEKLYKQVIQRMINKGMDEKDNAIIEMSLKLALIYGTWKDHEKANAGFKYCIEAQEKKMKSRKWKSLALGWNVILQG